GQRRHGFQELARRQGDFAIAGCALFFDEDRGRCRDPHVGAFGVADTPVRVPEVEALLADQPLTDELIGEASRTLSQVCTPPSDLHGTPDYRRALLAVLLERALKAAAFGAQAAAS